MKRVLQLGFLCLLVMTGCDGSAPTTEVEPEGEALSAAKRAETAASLEAHIAGIYLDIIHPVATRIGRTTGKEMADLEAATTFDERSARVSRLITEEQQKELLLRVQKLLADHPELATVSSNELKSIIESVSASAVARAAAEDSLGKSGVAASPSASCEHCHVGLTATITYLTLEQARCMAACPLTPCVLLCQVQYMLKITAAMSAYYACLIGCGGTGGGGPGECPNPGPNGCIQPE